LQDRAEQLRQQLDSSSDAKPANGAAATPASTKPGK
jgi:hypothetical protein